MNIISKKSFVTGCFENNHPAFLLIPFKQEHIFKNSEIATDHSVDLVGQLKKRYPNKHITITVNARTALELALENLSIKLGGKLNVQIETTTDNFYISSCVTKTIEKKHQWHRKRGSLAEVRLVNHEFGYADNRIIDGDNSSLLIEDCAFSFNSRFLNGERCGSIAPFSIFSFSKFFPIQLGGCLISDEPIDSSSEDKSTITYIENVVGFYFNKIEEWSNKRLDILKYYNKIFESFGCSPFFNYSLNDIPGVYLFNLPQHIDAQKLKVFYWERGVQCSVFYGEQAFFLPLNQYTTNSHIDYFADLFVYFISDNY